MSDDILRTTAGFFLNPLLTIRSVIKQACT